MGHLRGHLPAVGVVLPAGRLALALGELLAPAGLLGVLRAVARLAAERQAVAAPRPTPVVARPSLAARLLASPRRFPVLRPPIALRPRSAPRRLLPAGLPAPGLRRLAVGGLPSGRLLAALSRLSAGRLPGRASPTGLPTAGLVVPLHGLLLARGVVAPLARVAAVAYADPPPARRPFRLPLPAPRAVGGDDCHVALQPLLDVPLDLFRGALLVPAVAFSSVGASLVVAGPFPAASVLPASPSVSVVRHR